MTRFRPVTSKHQITAARELLRRYPHLADDLMDIDAHYPSTSDLEHAFVPSPRTWDNLRIHTHHRRKRSPKRAKLY